MLLTWVWDFFKKKDTYTSEKICQYLHEYLQPTNVRRDHTTTTFIQDTDMYYLRIDVCKKYTIFNFEFKDSPSRLKIYGNTNDWRINKLCYSQSQLEVCLHSVDKYIDAYSEKQ